VSYNFFVTRIDKLIREMEEGTSHVLNLIWDLQSYGGDAAALAAAGGVKRHGTMPATGAVEGMGTPDRGAAPDTDHQP
jgi:hypothetical protein